MAQTKDRRSEGKGTTGRAKRQALKALGLCTQCGVTAVKNRTCCIECVDRQQVYNTRASVRRFPEEAARVLRDLGFYVRSPKRNT